MALYHLTQGERNTIKRLLMTPCDPTAGVWFEAAIPALINAWWSSDFYVDPKHLYHQFTGEALVGSVAGGLKSAEGGGVTHKGIGAGLLTDAGEGVPTGGSKVLRGVLKLPGIIDNASYYMFLASLATKAGIDANTLAFNYSGCGSRADAGHIYSDSPWGAPHPDFWSPAGLWWYFDTHGNVFETTPGTSVATGETAHVACNIKGIGPDGFPCGFALQLINDDTGDIVDQISVSRDEAQDGARAQVFAPVYGPAVGFNSYSVQAKALTAAGKLGIITGGAMSKYVPKNFR